MCNRSNWLSVVVLREIREQHKQIDRGCHWHRVVFLSFMYLSPIDYVQNTVHGKIKYPDMWCISLFFFFCVCALTLRSAISCVPFHIHTRAHTHAHAHTVYSVIWACMSLNLFMVRGTLPTGNDVEVYEVYNKYWYLNMFCCTLISADRIKTIRHSQKYLLCSVSVLLVIHSLCNSNTIGVQGAQLGKD